MRHYVALKDQLGVVTQMIETDFLAGSPERQCLSAILSSDMEDVSKVAVGCLILGKDWEDAEEKLIQIKNISHSSSRGAIRDALNNFTKSYTDFKEFFEAKGFGFLQPENKWYSPRAEYIPGRLDNPKDTNRLAKVVAKIPTALQPVFKTAYDSYLRGRYRDPNIPTTRLSYSELCAVAGLLLPEELRNAYLNSLIKGSNHSIEVSHNKNMMHANELVISLCANYGIERPNYTLENYLSLNNKANAAPTAIAALRKKGPGLAQISFMQSARNGDDEVIEAVKPKRAPVTAATVSGPDQALVGRDGFDLHAAHAFIKTARKAGDLQVTDRAVEIFTLVAADNGLNQQDVFERLNVKPVVAGILYKKITDELKEAGFAPPAFQ